MRNRLYISMLVLGSVVWLAASCGDDKEGVGTDTLPEIEVTPPSLNFSAAAAGQEQTFVLDVKNVGAGDDLEIDRVYIRDEGTPFTFSGPMLTVVTVGDKTTIQVTYTATDTQPEPTALMIESNAANEPLVEIPISVTAAMSGLVMFPNPVEFGEVLGGTTKPVRLTITNSSPEQASISNAYIQIGSSLDFSVIEAPEFEAIIPAQGSIFIDLAYTPVGGGEDNGTLVIAYNEGGTKQLTTVLMHGTEVGPEINVAPPSLNFEWVAIDATKTLEFTVFNMGEHELHLESIVTTLESNADIKVDDGPSQTMIIKAGDKAKFHVTWSPKTFFEPTSDPIGGITITSNDNDESVLTIPVYGNIDAPFIKTDPDKTVDFGIVAQAWTIERTVTVTNVGHAPLILSGVEIVQNTPANEFEFVPGDSDGEFVDTAEIAANESVVVRLSFTNDGAATGTEMGKVKLTSNDPTKGELLLDMVANRGGKPECKLAFVPGKLEFGTVAHGANKTMTMFLKNNGSGYCSWKSAIIRDCVGFMGLMTQCTEAQGPSALFSPIGMPIPIQDGMAPGTSQPIQIKYTPPTTIPWIPIFEEYSAFIQVTYAEPYSNANGTYSEHKIPEASAQGTVNPNIHGSSGIADIAVLPPEIEFGLTTIGCYSQTLSVKVYNAGTAPLQVTDIYLENCGPEFALKAYPPLPVEIGASQFKEVSAVYLPQNEGKDECYMIIESSDLDTPLIKVPLRGEGTWDTEHTDYFTQISGRKVDILFVIDESASMCDEQDRLADNIQALTQHAFDWDNDFQLGITLTNIDADFEGVGKLLGSLRIINKTGVSAFPGTVATIGCGGSGTQESGLEAGRRALSPPLITDTDIPCSCGEDQPCPNVCAPELTCVKGKCGGYNRGFLRKDASLEVVFLSDEEDQSPGSVPFYIDFYKSIKGFLNVSMFHAHAICGDAGNGCGSNQQNGNDGADGGDRYIAVQEATGGKWGSICDDNFATVLSDIGEIAFGLQIQFFLTAQADPSPGSIRVWLDKGAGYKECQSGWEFHQPTNSVVFDENGTCMPVEGDKIKIWYKMVCYTE